MTTVRDRQGTAYCTSEYDALHKVILCPPTHMEIKDIINETQKQYAEENINPSKALQEHQMFARTLAENGVDVTLLPPKKEFPEQVFTRDIGFTIGGKVFVGEMAAEIRQGEEEVLAEKLEHDHIPFEQLKNGTIEGGDVIVDRSTVYVGVSSRTSGKAIEELNRRLPDHQIIPVPFKEEYLHLDCVFNILSEKDALVFPEAIESEALSVLESHYNLIEVSKEEQFTLGTNVLSIGGKKVLSLPVNENVNRSLRDRNFEVLEVDMSEIIKSGGSFRCCSMPVVRK